MIEGTALLPTITHHLSAVTIVPSTAHIKKPKGSGGEGRRGVWNDRSFNSVKFEKLQSNFQK